MKLTHCFYLRIVFFVTLFPFLLMLPWLYETGGEGGGGGRWELLVDNKLPT